MDIKNFMYLIEVAEAGSITKASQKLYISQPYLSKIIAEIEESFKVNIFIRTPQGVLLTTDGEKFLKQAKSVLKEYNKFYNLHSNSNRNGKTFSVTTNKSSLVVESFIRLVKEYKDVDIEFSIKESSGFEPIQDIYLLNSDLGIIYLKKSKKDIFLDELKRKRMSYHLISSLDPCIVTRSGHPLTLKKSPLVVEDLVDYGLLKYNNAVLSYEEDGDTHYHFYEYLIQKKKVKNIVSVSDRAAFHNILTQTDFISLGLGVARKQEEVFGIVSIPFDFPFDTNYLEMGIVYLKNHTLNHVAKRFIEILMNTYGHN